MPGRIRAFLSRRSSRVAPLNSPGEPSASGPSAARWWCICGRKNQVAPPAPLVAAPDAPLAAAPASPLAASALPPSLPPSGECSQPGPSEQDSGAFTTCPVITARLQTVKRSRTLKEGGGKERRAQIEFLAAILQACQEATRRGDRHLPFSKALAAKAVLEEMDNIYEDPVPHHLFSFCMEAITSLSRMKPGFGPKTVRTLIMDSLFVISHMVGEELEEDQDSPFQPPEKALQNMLRGLLQEKPTLAQLILMADAIDVEILSTHERKAAVAERTGLFLLNLAIGPPFHFEAEQIKPMLPLAVRQVGRTTGRAKGEGSHSSSEDDLFRGAMEFWDE
ncbi:uncharacterized protein LOC128337721 [Hemicordylus capensis]|uniref:uncharacterized protein LOC128337721 n=1 Tax=Hemicordylus capensis TaxID=884348 RepID=UPI0023041BD1|nr:uncharacterized protein LOC128337721 [Hemicordylus capensis]